MVLYVLVHSYSVIVGCRLNSYDFILRGAPLQPPISRPQPLFVKSNARVPSHRDERWYYLSPIISCIGNCLLSQCAIFWVEMTFMGAWGAWELTGLFLIRGWGRKIWGWKGWLRSWKSSEKILKRTKTNCNFVCTNVQLEMEHKWIRFDILWGRHVDRRGSNVPLFKSFLSSAWSSVTSLTQAPKRFIINDQYTILTWYQSIEKHLT